MSKKKKAFNLDDVVELTTQSYQLPGVFLATSSDFGRASTVSLDNTANVPPDELAPPKLPNQTVPVLHFDIDDQAAMMDEQDGGARRDFAFSEIVDEDDNEFLENYLTDELLGKLVESTKFKNAILLVIVLNTITVGLQTDIGLEKRFGSLFEILDLVFLTIFAVELFLKLSHGFFSFWRVGWNVFDFCIVAVSFLGDNVSFLSSGRVFRVFRALRALRGVSSLQGLQMVVQTVLRSLPDMLNILLLLVIIMFIFTVIGISLFGEIVPQHFGTLPGTALTLFVLLTQDGWVGIFNDIRAADESQYAVAAIYFTVFIVIGAFMFVNMIVGVTVTNLEKAYDELKKEKRAKTRELRKKVGKSTSAPCETIDVTSIAPEHWRSQVPHELPDMQHVSIQSLENYLLVLVAMEDNLVEYQKLKQELESIFNDVVGLNEALDVSDGESQDSDSSDGKAQGDALSQLIRAQRRDPGG